MSTAPRSAFIVAAALCACSPAGRDPDARLGYSADAFLRQDSLEKQFRFGVSAERISEFHRALTRRPHPAGSDASLAVADSLARWLKSFGLEVDTREYRVWLSRPREVSVALVTPVALPLRVTEPASPLDPDTKHPELGPGYVAYSASGDVTAPIVYANYGLPPDYDALAKLGVDVRGKIILARYGRSHRAVKLFSAEERGALGVILYSDPADDGFARGDTWPNGYWRTSELLQRGNAKYSWHFHGDPLTPGVAAHPGVARLDPKTAPTLPRIPAAVLSWGEAKKIHQRLDGAEAPPAFRGALPITYRVGGGTAKVRLRVQMDDGLRTIRNVIARLPGEYAGPGVMLGTHHDAWTFGGVDPGTGTAALLELARVLGALAHRGWLPHRAITLAFWDAEEPGLIGSTEYAEDRATALHREMMCYINTDLYTNGRFDAGGTPSLRDFVVEVAKDIRDSAGSVYDGWRAAELVRLKPPDPAGFEVDLKALGSGADFVPFQEFLGLPTLSLEFSATGGYGYGAYHSNYDTRFFTERVADPGFRRGATLVRLLGTTALRLAEAPVLPFRFSTYANKLSGYSASALEWARDSSGRETIRLDLTPLNAAISGAADAAVELERLIDRGLASGRLPATTTTAKLNSLLARMERRLLDESEPAEKRWYRHTVYGWNIYSLYDGQPYPGLADAIRRRDGDAAQREVARLTFAVERLRSGLRDAITLAR